MGKHEDHVRVVANGGGTFPTTNMPWQQKEITDKIINDSKK